MYRDTSVKRARVVIKAPFRCNGTTVEVDGVAIHGVRSVSFTHEAGEMPKVSLDLYPAEVVIEGDVEVERVLSCPTCRKLIP